jgi:membrane associated rhomboid family serine protease
VTSDSSGQSTAQSANVCYRHPDRQSYILCQRCGRTICSECQTQAAVGVHCPECVREARASAPRTKPAIVTALRRQGAPVVTYSLMSVSVLVFIAELVLGGRFVSAIVYFAPYTLIEPWRIVTHMFAHSPSFPYLHLVFNMLTLFLFGRVLESMLGRWRFLGLYAVSGLGGAVAVMLLSPDRPVLGASGAIFGLLAAYFVIQRRLGLNNPSLLVLIVLNLGAGFILPGISWQAHVGGLVVGAAVALVYMRTRRISQARLQVLLVVAIAAVLVVMLVVGGIALGRVIVP